MGVLGAVCAGEGRTGVVAAREGVVGGLGLAVDVVEAARELGGSGCPALSAGMLLKAVVIVLVLVPVVTGERAGNLRSNLSRLVVLMLLLFRLAPVTVGESASNTRSSAARLGGPSSFEKSCPPLVLCAVMLVSGPLEALELRVVEAVFSPWPAVEVGRLRTRSGAVTAGGKSALMGGDCGWMTGDGAASGRVGDDLVHGDSGRGGKALSLSDPPLTTRAELYNPSGATAVKGSAVPRSGFSSSSSAVWQDAAKSRLGVGGRRRGMGLGDAGGDNGGEPHTLTSGVKSNERSRLRSSSAPNTLEWESWERMLGVTLRR
jgi:hypothetical protein